MATPRRLRAVVQAVLVPEALDCLAGQVVVGPLAAKVVEETKLVASKDVVVGAGDETRPQAGQLALKKGGHGGINTSLRLAGEIESLLKGEDVVSVDCLSVTHGGMIVFDGR